MSVQARTDKFSAVAINYYRNCVEKTTNYYADGSITTSQRGWTQAEHSCQRNPKTANWYKPVGSTGVLFRSPSSYNRGIRDAQYEDGAWEKNATNINLRKQVVEGPPDIKASWSMLDCPPLVSGNFPALDQNLQNQAVTECLLKFKGKNSIGLGANLAEAKQTANQLARSGYTLAYILAAAKRGQWGLIPKQFGIHFGDSKSKRFANAYLEGKYGWMPLVSDIHSGLELMKEHLSKGMIISAERHVTDAGGYTGHIVGGFECHSHGTRVHSCKLYAILDSTLKHRADQFGLVNPLSWAWEATKLSFVIDWLVPVGGFLEALTATSGLTFAGGYTSRTVEYSAMARQIPPNGWDELAPKTAQLQGYGLVRSRLTAFPSPVPYVKSPFSTSHVGSAIALIHQLSFR